MAEFTPAEMSQVLTACQDNTAAITECFNQCFLTEGALTVGELLPWSSDSIPSELSGPGILVTFQLGAAVVLAALPESLPLPEWCRNPGKSESSRLQTLPVEWSMNVFPMEWESDSSTSQFVQDLASVVASCEPLEGSSFLKLVWNDNQTGPGAYLIGTCRQVYTAPVEESPEPFSTPSGSFTPPAESSPPPPTLTPEAAAEYQSRLRRAAQMMNMPVPIIVVMAAKKIQLGQLLSMGPGTIISFDKSCDDLLDLCVNNRALCSGEAVKIGEKFGLKVNYLSSTADRQKQIQRSRVI